MSKRFLIYIIIGLAILAGFYVFAKPKQSAPSETQTKKFELVVKDKKLISGPETLQVHQDDNIQITITANEDEELHLHGYDISVDLEKDKPATLSFKASLTGRFLYELEKSKIEIGALEVSPK